MENVFKMTLFAIISIQALYHSKPLASSLTELLITILFLQTDMRFNHILFSRRTEILHYPEKGQ